MNLYTFHVYINKKKCYNNHQEVKTMLSEAQKRGNNKYLAKFDDIKIRVKQGYREQYKKFAQEQGKSLNAYFIELIEKEMQEKGFKLRSTDTEENDQ